MLDFLTNPIVYKAIQGATVIASVSLVTLIGTIVSNGGFAEDGQTNSNRIKYYTVTKNKNKYKRFKEHSEYKKSNNKKKSGF